MKYLPETSIKNQEVRITYKKSALLAAFPVILYTFFLILNTPPAARAQESLRSMTITPPTVSQTLDPGGRAEGTMKLINDTDVPLTFQATVRDFMVEDNFGTPTLLPPSTLSRRFSGAAWVGIVPDTFTVKPRDKEIMHYYLQVPADARPGGHYAAVVFKPTNAVGVTGTGASVDTQIGSLFYIDVKGAITEKAEVTRFAIRGFSEYGPLTATTLIKNLGDLHIKPEGYITVSNMFGRKAYTAPLAEYNIFPDASRQYTNTFGRKWMIGRYTAVLSATYGRKNDLPLTYTLSFWVFPWKLAVVVVLLLVAAVLGGMYLKKRRKGSKPTTSEPKAEGAETEVKTEEKPRE